VLNTNAAVSILRATYFQDNVAVLLPMAERDGVYLDFLPPGAGALVTIAAADVGAFAARALLEPSRRDREIVDLLGPCYTPGEIADALARVVGRRVDAVHVPAASQVEQFQQWMSPEAATAMVETLQCLGSKLRALSADPARTAPSALSIPNRTPAEWSTARRNSTRSFALPWRTPRWPGTRHGPRPPRHHGRFCESCPRDRPRVTACG
jgi:hypothetical protein